MFKTLKKPSNFYRLILVVNLSFTLQLANATCSVKNGFSTGEGSQPSTIWFTPNGKFAYVLLGGNNKILAYQYDKSKGKLTRDTHFEISSGGVSPTFGGTITPDSRFMYVTNRDTSTIVVFSINQDNGELKQIQLIKTPFYYPYVVALSPDGLYLYVTVFEANKLLLYRVNQQNGTLVPLMTLQHPDGYINTQTQPFVLNFSPSKKYAYLASYGENSIVRYAYNVDNGDLTLDYSWRLTTPLLTKPYALLFDPSGKYAYAPADMRNKILQFINDNDQLIPNIPAEVSTGNNPNTFIQFYADDKYAYIGNFNDNTIDMYRLQSNGTMVALASRYRTITGPIVLRQPPDQTHMFVLSRVENCIADYTVNSETGVLEPRFVNTDTNVNGGFSSAKYSIDK